MQKIQLSDLCQINPKHTLKGFDDNQKVSFIGMADVSEVTKSIINITEKNLSAVRNGFTHFVNDDVIVAKITPCYENGKMAIVNIPHDIAFGSTEFHVFRVNKNKILPKFIFYFLSSSKVRQSGAKSMTGSAGQKRVPIKFFQNLKVPLPSIDEQKCIVKILTQADSLRLKRKQVIELLDDYLESIFLEMFRDSINDLNTYQSIGETANFIDYRGKTPEKSKSGIPLITAKHVKKGFFSFYPEEYITEEKYNKIMTRGFPRANDVLFTTEGATLGNVCRIPYHIDRFGVGQRLITLQCKNCLTSEYLHYILLNGKIRQEIFKNATGSAAQGIRSAVFSKIKIPVPPKNLQEKFSVIVKNSESLKQKMLMQSQQLDTQYQALIQKSFQTKEHSMIMD